MTFTRQAGAEPAWQGVALMSRTGMEQCRASHPPAGSSQACIRVWKVEQGTQESLLTRLYLHEAEFCCCSHTLLGA